MLRAVVIAAVLGVLPALVSADEIRDSSYTAPVVISDEQSPEHRLYNVQITKVREASALTLVGRLHTVVIEACRIGNVTGGASGRAAALDAGGAMISSLTISNSRFFDSEGPLLNLAEGSFGTVSVEGCTFRVSDSFRQKMQERNAWRQSLPAAQFANIQRLELIDNDFADVPVVIHPSVRQVIVRGPIANLRLLSEKTELVVIEPEGKPADDAAARVELAGK